MNSAAYSGLEIKLAFVPDLIVAATAESAGLVVLHDDKGFELITEITCQPVHRLAD